MIRGSAGSCLQKAVFEVWRKAVIALPGFFGKVVTEIKASVRSKVSVHKSCTFLKRFTIVGYISLAILLLSGCFSPKGMETATQDEEAIVLHKVAVIPFQSLISEDPSVKFVRCPVSGIMFSTCPCQDNPEVIIEEILVKRLTAHRQVVLIPGDKVRGTYRRVRANSFKATPREIFGQVGRELNADGVLAGYIYRYRERKGNNYSVKQPASVAFGIHLFRVSDGNFVWRGIFDKTQGSLLENILDVSSFLKGGGKWVTARQLSEAGVDKILKTFPDRENK